MSAPLTLPETPGATPEPKRPIMAGPRSRPQRPSDEPPTRRPWRVRGRAAVDRYQPRVAPVLRVGGPQSPSGWPDPSGVAVELKLPVQDAFAPESPMRYVS